MMARRGLREREFGKDFRDGLSAERESFGDPVMEMIP
jgi:hypothetical protein